MILGTGDLKAKLHKGYSRSHDRFIHLGTAGNIIANIELIDAGRNLANLALERIGKVTLSAANARFPRKGNARAATAARARTFNRYREKRLTTEYGTHVCHQSSGCVP